MPIYYAGPWKKEELLRVNINGHDHMALPIYSKEMTDRQFPDGTGVCAVIAPVEEFAMSHAVRLGACADLICKAPDMAKLLRKIADAWGAGRMTSDLFYELVNLVKELDT